ncbi:MAG TPA: zinc-binding dehydrogenase [Stellaceae bacterium]|nr:zinc-binding dehydrogenase [Stellaceae bacterium]
MKAMVMREFGPPEVMRLEEVPTPSPGPGEVLVAVKAVSVNRTLDLIVRSGKYPRPVALPHVLGVDPSGIVTAVGPGVATRKVGDRVTSYLRLDAGPPSGAPVMLGLTVWGGYAEYVVLPERCTYIVPDNVDFATATIVARHAPLAFSMLRDKAKVAAGEWVLVMGAAGGLGSAAVQAAKYLGAKVIAAAGSDERVAAAMELGGDAGVNYRSADLTAEARRITGGRGVDIVLENIGDPDLFAKAFLSLGRGGRLVTAGSHGGGVVPVNVSHLYFNHIAIMGWTGQSDADVNDSLKAASEGRFRVLVDKILPLREAAEAHRIVGARDGLGKVVLEP